MNADLVHGGGLAAMRSAFPNAPLPWIDLSTGINPWPYPLGDIPISAYARLPDADLESDALTAAAHCFGSTPEHIALTPGSQAAIQILPALLSPRSVAVLAPTYSEHAQSWRRAGAQVSAIADLAETDRFDCVVIVNPNNPTGRVFSPETLRALAERLAARGGVLIVDEAFADTTPALSVAPFASNHGLIVLRSFGKFFGLAGLRLGALIGAPNLAARARQALGAWAVSGPALTIAARAYRDHGWAGAMRAHLQDRARLLDLVVQGAGLHVAGGTSLYRWIKAPAAHTLWRRLAARGIYVRRFAWCEDHLRIGLPADDAAMERLARDLGDAG